MKNQFYYTKYINSMGKIRWIIGDDDFLFKNNIFKEQNNYNDDGINNLNCINLIITYLNKYLG